MCAAGAAKLHRSGMVSLSLRHRQWSVEIKALVSAAPTELGRETWVVAATNMAFLTELAPLALPKMCIKHSNALRLWEWERRLESGRALPHSKTLARRPRLAPVQGHKARQNIRAGAPISNYRTRHFLMLTMQQTKPRT